MTTAIYYPRSTCSLGDITNHFCPTAQPPENFGRRIQQANRRASSLDTLFTPNKPVIIPESDDRSVNVSAILSCSPEQQAGLSSLSHYAGGGAVMGLAQLLWDTKIPAAVGDLNTFGGNGMGAALANSNAILKAINEYDLSLMKYEQLKNHRASPSMVKAAKLQAEHAFRHMNQLFGSKAMNYLNSNTFQMRPTVNAAGRQVWESIPVHTAADVQKLAQFAKVARIAGPGFVVLDGYLRGNKVSHMRRENDPQWRREAFVQTGAFGLGIVGGVIVGAVVAVTPLGMTIALVAGGLTALGVDYGAQAGLGKMQDIFFND